MTCETTTGKKRSRVFLLFNPGLTRPSADAPLRLAVANELGRPGMCSATTLGGALSVRNHYSEDTGHGKEKDNHQHNPPTPAPQNLPNHMKGSGTLPSRLNLWARRANAKYFSKKSGDKLGDGTGAPQTTHPPARTGVCT